MMTQIILASASPRRQEILKLLAIPFEARPAPDEPPINRDLPPHKAVLEVARYKAEYISRLYSAAYTVIGADTVVSIDGELLGKPKSENDAAEMLRRLSGRTHTVYTGVWVCGCPHGHEKSAGFTDATDVHFYPLSQQDIEWYISTGEPMDKAGAYGIQGKGMRFIRSITGDFYNVMGLPAARLYRFLNHPSDEYQ